MSSSANEAVVIGRGFQPLSSYHFNHAIRCVAPQGNESVAVHYTAGYEHITSICPVTPHSRAQNRVSLEKAVQHMLYVRKYQVYVMSCLDLSLRVFSKEFQHIQTLHVTSTILCMEFVESTSILYTGESGCVKMWQLRQQLHCPIVPLNESTVHVGKDQWVIALDYEEETEKVTAATEDEVIVIHKNIHQQQSSYASQHESTLTGALLFSTFGCLVLSFKDGSINVLNTFLHTVVHRLSGHTKAITALKRHPMGSCFLSCSLDGTVKVWDLETLTECYKVEFGMEVLGMRVTIQSCDTIQLVCHSYNDVKIWQHTQLESHFTSVNSHTVALSRIESAGIARVMATSEDGCVRLLSPITGEVITILFPVFTSNVLSEVLYCPLGGLLFALLTTGEVLVLSGHTNPCSTIELWTTHEKERIESMCLCIIEWKGKQYSLLVGGGVSGYISLLHSSNFTMPQPCPAHGGCVCKVVSPSSLVALSDTTSTPCLLSFGSDNFLNVWSLVVSERGDHVGLRMQICIQMETVPKHIGILDTLLCVTTIKNSVKMLNISTELRTALQNCCLPRGCLFNRMPILSHQREDCHTDIITSLSCCHSLGLFVTSSHDGFLKVWSTSNQLVSEIFFGDSLMCACFLNAGGDLLVGFQRQICIVRASNYLPSPYLQQSMEYCISDCAEDPIIFDPTLEFWYDMTALPVQLEKRKQHSTLNDYYVKFSGDQLAFKGSYSSKQGMGRENREATTSLSEVVDVQLTRKDSHHFLASLVENNSSMADISLPNKTGPSLSSLRSSILSALEAIQAQDLVNGSHKRHSLTIPPQTKGTVTPVKNFPAEVTPLQSTASKLPIAPDCLIPNSTIRKLIGYIPPPDTVILQQLPLNTTNKILSTTTPGTLQSSSESTSEQLNGIPATDISGSTGACNEEEISSNNVMKSEVFADGLEDGVEISESRVNLIASEEPIPSDDLCHIATDNRKSDIATDDGESLSNREMSDLTVHHSPTPHVFSDGSLSTPAPQPSSPISCHSKESNMPVGSVHSVMPRNASLRKDNSSPAVKTEVVPAVKTKVVPAVTIPFQMRPPPATVVTTTHRDTSGATDKQLADVENEESEGMKVLQRIMKRVWFPRITADITTEKEKICDKIVSMLSSVNVAFIGDIGTALVDLRRVSILTEAQVSETIKVVISRLTCTKCDRTKKALLVTLERLPVGVVTDGVVVTILPHLVDPNMDVRNSAFNALKTIAGITNRSQLHHRLIEMGLLQHTESNEDEVLKELSQRLESRSAVRPKTVRNSLKLSKVDGQHSETIATRHSTSTGGDDSSSLPSPVDTSMNLPVTTDCQKSINSREKQSTDSPLRRSNGEDPQDLHRTMYRSYRAEDYSHYQGSRTASGVENRHADLAIFHARLQCQPTLPSIITTASTRPRNQTGTRQSVTIYNGKKVINSNNGVKKVQRLLATQPTVFSQTIPARDVIVRAYATRSHKPAGGAVRMETQREFKWTEVFPVLKETSKKGNIGEKENGQDDEESTKAMTTPVVLPKLTKNGRWVPETYPEFCATSSTELKTRARKEIIGIKLPHITN